MASRSRKGPTSGTLLAAVVFAVIGIAMGYVAAWGNIADACDRYGIGYVGSVAYDCHRREVK